MKKILILSVLLLQSCKKAPTEKIEYFVAVKPQIVFRDMPNTSGKAIGAIPYDAKVEIINNSGPTSTALGLTGAWYQVKFNGVTGWVFGPFIRNSTEAFYFEIQAGTATKHEVTKPSAATESKEGANAILLYNGKTWTQCFLGESYVNGKCTGQAEGYLGGQNPCTSLQLANKKWRHPTLQELQSLEGSPIAAFGTPGKHITLYSNEEPSNSDTPDLYYYIDNTWAVGTSVHRTGEKLCISD